MAQDHLIESTNYPYLDIRVEIQGVQLQGPALLDTGYTGELIIPERTLALLGPPIDNRNIFLGNNQPVLSPWYMGTLQIIGVAEDFRSTFIQVIGDEYIMGREILDLFEITFDHGQRVVVRP